MQVIKPLFCLLLTTCNQMDSNDKIWKMINESTWLQEDSFAGSGYTFYENNKGEKRCIYQIYGSGVYAVSQSFYKVTIEKDTLKLFVNIATSLEAEPDYHLQETFVFNDSCLETVKDKKKLKLFSKIPIIYVISPSENGETRQNIEEIKKMSIR
ncbi:MAG: hypothetical protein EPN85_12625 [Bacteroidetes bacterium]|nr:MAG: hypothetical protein EPN85_12625 [Bacteroidota bacterium]